MAEVDPQSQHFLAPWCEEDDIPEGRRAGIADVSLAFAIACATEVLFVLSGRQYRSGRSIVRPTPIGSAYGNQSYLYPYSSMSGYGAAWGFAAGWSWTALGMGWWQSGQDLSEVVLQGPVQKINQVLVDGQTLSSSDYTLYDRRRLVRNVDASGQTSGAWPWNQQLQLPLTEPGTWAIDYDWGRVPPQLGKAASIELSIELARTLAGEQESRLPARVLSVATGGVSVAVGDALSFIEQDFTGIPIVDLFLRTYNKGKLRRRTIFLGPNSQQGRELTNLQGTGPG